VTSSINPGRATELLETPLARPTTMLCH